MSETLSVKTIQQHDLPYQKSQSFSVHLSGGQALECTITVPLVIPRSGEPVVARLPKRVLVSAQGMELLGRKVDVEAHFDVDEQLVPSLDCASVTSPSGEPFKGDDFELAVGVADFAARATLLWWWDITGSAELSFGLTLHNLRAATQSMRLE